MSQDNSDSGSTISTQDVSVIWTGNPMDTELEVTRPRHELIGTSSQGKLHGLAERLRSR